jgi:hypothetical protein
VGPVPAHRWRETKLQFEQPDGSWGDAVDLKGEKGERGQNGASGGVVVQQGGNGGGTGNSYFPSGW